LGQAEDPLHRNEPAAGLFAGVALVFQATAARRSRGSKHVAFAKEYISIEWIYGAFYQSS
jgi:hypothetical protein